MGVRGTGHARRVGHGDPLHGCARDRVVPRAVHPPLQVVRARVRVRVGSGWGSGSAVRVSGQAVRVRAGIRVRSG